MLEDAPPLDRDRLKRQVAEALDEAPGSMTSQLARRFNVAEADIIRALPEDRVTELDIGRWEALLRALEPIGRVHVICNSAAVPLECFGQFGNFSRTGPFFNVQTKSLDMHIRHERLASVFAVQKPSHSDERITYSVQFFDGDGRSAFKVFLNFGHAAEDERVAFFHELRERLAAAS